MIDVDADMGYWRCRTRHLSRARRPKLSGPIVWAVGIRRCFVEKKKKMPIDPKVTVPTHTRRKREAMASCVLTRCPDGASPSAFFGMLQAKNGWGTVSADERRGGERVLF